MAEAKLEEIKSELAMPAELPHTGIGVKIELSGGEITSNDWTAARILRNRMKAASFNMPHANNGFDFRDETLVNFLGQKGWGDMPPVSIGCGTMGQIIVETDQELTYYKTNTDGVTDVRNLPRAPGSNAIRFAPGASREALSFKIFPRRGGLEVKLTFSKAPGR